MPINSTTPVATKALSVASKKLCLSPIAWPSIRANGSLAATSLLQTWSPYLHSMTWNSEVYDQRPQCRASKQYSGLASLLDVIPPSLSESSQQVATSLAQDVDVVQAIAGCEKPVHASEQGSRDELQSSATYSMQDSATPDAYSLHSRNRLDNASADSSTSCDTQRLLHDACIQSAEAVVTKCQDNVTQDERLRPSDHRSYSPASAYATMLNSTLIGNPGIATSMARHDYESYVRRLERRCFDLFAENQELRTSADKTKASHSRTQELNLRLGREVQQARREAAAATEQLRQYVDKADKAIARSKRRRAVRDQSTQTSSCGTTGDFGSIDAMDCVQQHSHDRCISVSPTSEETSEACLAFYPPGLDGSDATSRNSSPQEEGIASECKCDESCSWGCSFHRSYRNRLLLAHRDLHMAIAAHSPPGLEPPCDHIAKMNSGDLGMRVVPIASVMENCKPRRGEAHR